MNHIYFTPPEGLAPLVVYPNPSSDFLRIRYQEQPIDYTIYSVNGQLMDEGTYSPSTGIDIQPMTSGLYILRLQDGRRVSFLKSE